MNTGIEWNPQGTSILLSLHATSVHWYIIYWCTEIIYIYALIYYHGNIVLDIILYWRFIRMYSREWAYSAYRLQGVQSSRRTIFSQCQSIKKITTSLYLSINVKGDVRTASGRVHPMRVVWFIVRMMIQTLFFEIFSISIDYLLLPASWLDNYWHILICVQVFPQLWGASHCRIRHKIHLHCHFWKCTKITVRRSVQIDQSKLLCSNLWN